MDKEHFSHILLDHPPLKTLYTSAVSGGGGEKKLPTRDRLSHSQQLTSQLKQAWEESENEHNVYLSNRTGVYLEFKGEAEYEMVTKSLENRRSKNNENWIRLLNVREEAQTKVNSSAEVVENQSVTYATVYVPNSQKNKFFSVIEKYANEIDSRSDKPKNFNLINSISELRKALLVESFWQDNKDLIPQDDAVWCEVWLSSDDERIIKDFEDLLASQNINSRSGRIRFPERAVKVIEANRSQLEMITRLSDDIAEYRLAKETSSFWLEMTPREEVSWVEDLQRRLKIDKTSKVSILLLDTGVNNGHPLLEPFLDIADCQAVHNSWGVHDHDMHGTLMAGVAVFGDLMECIISSASLNICHSLESVKILPLPPDSNHPDIWGDITAQGIFKAEINAADKKRIICMAITAEDTRDQGRPSSWSGEIDQLCSGAEEEGNIKRLIIISAGNITDLNIAINYPEAQITDSIHDPAQSWNSLTVGAYTKLQNISDPTLKGYRPLAPSEGLSPFSTCSSCWEDKWPIKPEVVMEGGNLAIQGRSFTECDDLSLLSTSYEPLRGHFYPFSMTSAASAKAAWFAAQIQTEYPEYWPETIRALMVHSAEWPNTLKDQFLKNDSKTAYKNLLRVCGYGVPNLENAKYSARNSLTLISQASLQPFDKKEHGSGYRTKDLDLYDLPWPSDILLSLPAKTKVKMKITLSYFIEPGPGEIGWKDRYRYASHALRFDIKSPSESKEEFSKRINSAARSEGENKPETESASKHWLLGSNNRDKGSIHSDTWQGSAADLATSNIIAVYPVIGWWRERPHIGRWNRESRYSLIVSIETPEEKIDLYTPVAIKVGLVTPVQIAT